MAHPYYCKECGAAATVVDGEVRRTCAHVGSTIIAERTSTLYGDGGVAPAGRSRILERVRQLLRRV